MFVHNYRGVINRPKRLPPEGTDCHGHKYLRNGEQRIPSGKSGGDYCCIYAVGSNTGWLNALLAELLDANARTL